MHSQEASSDYGDQTSDKQLPSLRHMDACVREYILPLQTTSVFVKTQENLGRKKGSELHEKYVSKKKIHIRTSHISAAGKHTVNKPSAVIFSLSPLCETL